MASKKLRTQIQSPQPSHRRTIPFSHPAFWLIPAFVIFGLISRHFSFTQDDAFISYRYVMNALHGHGLVYNLGERIEGYTNFGWVILLMAAGRLGLDIVSVSSLLGFLCGITCLYVTWRLARILVADRPVVFTALAVFLVAFNGACAYWSQAGLETACFAAMVTLSILFFLTRNRLLIATLLAGVWIRPDGAVVAALLILIELIVEGKFPKFAVICAGGALLASFPFIGFKLWYYGSILPNPFYAKTSFDLTQLANGLSYTWDFMLQYGFLGLGLLIPLIRFKQLDSPQRSLWLFVVGYIAYVTFVGGDVLKVHRFFLPIFGPSALLVALSVNLLLSGVTRKAQTSVAALITLVLLALTWFLPLRDITAYLARERGLVMVMKLEGQKLLERDSRNSSVATSTIGALGYTLLDHRVIDLVGLTDSTIARHPQTDIAGITSTWKEGKFNAGYVLQQSPDYIIFNTGAKPSSPGEQALFLYDAFLDSYRSFTLAQIPLGPGRNPRPCLAYQRVRPIVPPITPSHSVNFVATLKHGEELVDQRRFAEALQVFHDAELALGSKVYPELQWQQAATLEELGRQRDAYVLMDDILSRDSLVVWPHRDFYMTAAVQGDLPKVTLHRRFLQMLSPEDLAYADTVVVQYLRSGRRK